MHFFADLSQTFGKKMKDSDVLNADNPCHVELCFGRPSKPISIKSHGRFLFHLQYCETVYVSLMCWHKCTKIRPSTCDKNY